MPAPVRVAVCAEVLYNERVPPADTVSKMVLLPLAVSFAVLVMVSVSLETAEPLRYNATVKLSLGTEPFAK